MTQTVSRLRGTAAAVVELLGEGVVSDMYAPEGARFYHSLTCREPAEIEEMLRLVDGVAGPLLELACGSGRLTIPFLRKGFDVVGLDISPPMLDLLEDRLGEPDAAGLRDRLTAVHGDMADFSLGRRFAVIVLGASAVWTVDAQRRASLFRAVREHLTDDGRFLVTLTEFPGLETASDAFETTATFVTTDSEPPALVTFFDYVDPAEALRSTNIMTQAVVNGEIVQTSMFTTLTHLVSPAMLEKEMEAEGLTVSGRHEVTSGYQMLKASARPAVVHLLEATRAQEPGRRGQVA